MQVTSLQKQEAFPLKEKKKKNTLYRKYRILPEYFITIVTAPVACQFQYYVRIQTAVMITAGKGGGRTGKESGQGLDFP